VGCCEDDGSWAIREQWLREGQRSGLQEGRGQCELGRGSLLAIMELLPRHQHGDTFGLGE
jgi:hypothetical protein